MGFLAGLVPKEKTMAFERILFRATRGNVYLRQAAVEEAVTDPSSGGKVDNAFIHISLILMNSLTLDLILFGSFVFRSMLTLKLNCSGSFFVFRGYGKIHFLQLQTKSIPHELYQYSLYLVTLILFT